MPKKQILAVAIQIVFHPSKLLWGWLLIFSILCMASVWLTVPLPGAVSLTLIFAISLWWQMQRWPGYASPVSPRSLQVDIYGQVFLELANQEVWQIEVLADSVVHTAGMLLHVRFLPASGSQQLPTRRYPRVLLILPDHAPTESLRALRVWLRWGRPLSR